MYKLYILYLQGAGAVAHTFNPSTRETDLYESEASMVNPVGFRIAKGMQRALSQTKPNQHKRCPRVRVFSWTQVHPLPRSLAQRPPFKTTISLHCDNFIALYKNELQSVCINLRMCTALHFLLYTYVWMCTHTVMCIHVYLIMCSTFLSAAFGDCALYLEWLSTLWLLTASSVSQVVLSPHASFSSTFF